MAKFQIEADPKQNVGMAVGTSICRKVHYIAFEGVHDVAKGLSGKRRFVLHVDEDDMLWMIESLAKELPQALRSDAVARIEKIAST